MPLTIWNCVLSYKQNSNFSERQLALPRNYFYNRFLSSNCLLPIFLTGSKLGFQVANLLLATVNFEPCTLQQQLCKDLNNLDTEKWNRLVLKCSNVS